MAGCDDGTVRVFGAEGGERGLQYERTLARLKGRVLALAWHPTGATLVAGGADGCIHALDPVTGERTASWCRPSARPCTCMHAPSHAQTPARPTSARRAGVESMRITASASTRSPVCVWRLLVLPDGTLVSGDSSGAVQFWDGRFGTLLHRTTLHAADVLALAASGDGQRVWAAGVDTRVAMFERVAAAAPPPPATAGPTGMPAAAATKEGWAYTHYKRPHSHDVRALCVAAVGGGGGAAGKKKGKGGASSEVLISGGADAQLIAYPASRSFLNVHPARLTKAPQRPLCVLAAAAASATPAPRAAEPEQPARKKQKQQQQPAAAPPPQAAAGAEASAAPRLLLCAHDAALDVWQLGSAAATASASAPHPHPHQHQHPHRQPAHAWVEGQSLDLTSGPRHLVRIKLGDGARAGACSLSPDGNYVAAVTGSKGALRLYALVRSHSGGAGAQQQQQQPAPPDVRRVALQHLAGGERHVVATCFAGASLLVAADQAGTLSVLRLPPHNALLAAGQGGDDQPAAEPPQGPRAAALEAQCRLPSSATPSSTPGRLGKANAQGPQGWRGFLPPVSLLCASPDGSTVAAVGPSGVSLFRLTPPAATSGAPEAAPALLEAAMAAPLQLPQDAPVTAAAFSPDGKLLALAFASAEVQVVDVEAKRPTDWSVANAAGIATCVHQLPGSPAGLSFAPTAASGGGPMLLVFSPGGFCTFDLSRPVQAPESGGKRKRGRAKPADGPQQRAGAGPAVDHHQRAPSGGDAAAQQQQQQQHQKGGVNGRTVLLPDPVALVSFLGPSELLLLEKPWEDVVAALPPPLHKHRYGN